MQFYAQTLLYAIKPGRSSSEIFHSLMESYNFHLTLYHQDVVHLYYYAHLLIVRKLIKMPNKVHLLLDTIERLPPIGSYNNVDFQTVSSSIRSIIDYFQRLKEDEIEKLHLKLFEPLNNLVTKAELENSYMILGEEISKNDIEILSSK